MLEYRDEYPKLPLVIIHLLDDMVKTKNQVMKDTIHELVAIIVTERNVDDFVEEDLLENEGTLVKSRLTRGKAKFLGIVDKAYLMTVVKHAKRPNMYILVISGAEVETKTLNEEVEELEENEITIPIEDENDREKAQELAEKLEECAITEFKVDEDGEDELSITYTNGNKDKVEEILEECGVELSDENDEFDEAVDGAARGWLSYYLPANGPKVLRTGKSVNLSEVYKSKEDRDKYERYSEEYTADSIKKLCKMIKDAGGKVINFIFKDMLFTEEEYKIIDVLKSFGLTKKTIGKGWNGGFEELPKKDWAKIDKHIVQFNDIDYNAKGFGGFWSLEYYLPSDAPEARKMKRMSFDPTEEGFDDKDYTNIYFLQGEGNLKSSNIKQFCQKLKSLGGKPTEFKFDLYYSPEEYKTIKVLQSFGLLKKYIYKNGGISGFEETPITKEEWTRLEKGKVDEDEPLEEATKKSNVSKKSTSSKYSDDEDDLDDTPPTKPTKYSKKSDYYEFTFLSEQAYKKGLVALKLAGKINNVSEFIDDEDWSKTVSVNADVKVINKIIDKLQPIKKLVRIGNGIADMGLSLYKGYF